MNEDDRGAKLPIELPNYLRADLLSAYRRMLHNGRAAPTVQGILDAVRNGKQDWYSVLRQQDLYSEGGLYPRAYWRTMAIGVPDVLVVAHTMKIFPDIVPDENEKEVFEEIKMLFEFKLSLIGAQEELPLDMRIMQILQEDTKRAEKKQKPEPETIFEPGFSFRRQIRN